MITIDKFRDAVTKQHALSVKVYRTRFAWWLLLPFAFGVVSALIPGTWAYDFLAIALGIFLIIFLVVSRNDFRSRSDPRMVCPHCGEGLSSRVSLVIATGDCPRCGAHVLDDPSKGKKPLWPDPEL